MPQSCTCAFMQVCRIYTFSVVLAEWRPVMRPRPSISLNGEQEPRRHDGFHAIHGDVEIVKPADHHGAEPYAALRVLDQNAALDPLVGIIAETLRQHTPSARDRPMRDGEKGMCALGRIPVWRLANRLNSARGFPFRTHFQQPPIWRRTVSQRHGSRANPACYDNSVQGSFD